VSKQDASCRGEWDIRLRPTKETQQWKEKEAWRANAAVTRTVEKWRTERERLVLGEDDVDLTWAAFGSDAGGGGHHDTTSGPAVRICKGAEDSIAGASE